MAPKRNTQQANERRDEEQLNEWAELRKTLLAMQENVQATITTSIHELAETVLKNLHQQHVSEKEGSEEGRDNPFAHDRRHCFQNRDER